MSILRNSISITGITPENGLPKQIKGELLEHSDVDYIFLPGTKPGAKTINSVTIDVDLKSERVINAPTGTIVILDGVKNINISYTPVGHSRSLVTASLQLPYNTFFELPDGIKDSDNIDIYIADAYFQLVDSRKIYSYLFYIVDINYEEKDTSQDSVQEEFQMSEDDIVKFIEPFDDELLEKNDSQPINEDELFEQNDLLPIDEDDGQE